MVSLEQGVVVATQILPATAAHRMHVIIEILMLLTTASLVRFIRAVFLTVTYPGGLDTNAAIATLMRVRTTCSVS